LAGGKSGQCVDAQGMGSAGGTGGLDPSDPCEAIDCGAGRCVAVDGAPTCACDPDHYALEDTLRCTLDPCGAHRCFFVDAQDGNDDAPGTSEQPWRSLAGAMQAFVEGQQPGDHLLLRRGV